MSAEQTDSGDDWQSKKFISDDHRVSKAALHLAYPLRRNITKKNLNELIEVGHTIQRGRFSAKENKRLLKNWRRICRRYPQLNNPFAAVGLSVKPERTHGHIIDTIVDGKTKKFFRQSKILERLAYKLNDRLLCDIYSRAKKLIGGQAFKYQSREQLPSKLEQTAKKMLINNEDTPQGISCDLDISPFVLQNLKSNPTKMPKHMWTDEHDLLLEMCIERQSNRDPWTLPFRQIDWKIVSKEMISCGLPAKRMCPKQLYKRWYFLNGQMANSIKRRQITKTDLSDDNSD